MKAFWNEFKTFISRGSVMDMAVGIIIGGAFTAIVNSLVNDLVMPLLSLLTGGFDFTVGCTRLGGRCGNAQLRTVHLGSHQFPSDRVCDLLPYQIDQQDER